MLTDSWNTTAADDGNFDLWVYGTNGFVRNFQQNALVMAGAADATGGGEAPATAGVTEAASVPGFRPEIQICYDPCHGQIILKMHNDGGTSGEVTVTSNAYRTDGPWSLEVDAGNANSLVWNLAASGYWYDFTVQSLGFARRFAGRMETGQNGVSDPAMAQGLLV
jgi:phospholipase C